MRKMKKDGSSEKEREKCEEEEEGENLTKERVKL